ncbi:MAG: serine hydrolase domain-containing protein, partial [Pseudomonadales bacterium]
MTTTYQIIMSRVARLTFISLLLVTSIGWAVQSQADGSSLTRSTPESVGMSSERLERLSAGMQTLVDEGRLAGITTMITRHGKIVHFETFGHQDMAAGTAMAEDSIFRIYSMSKPITGVALMMLYEEGLFRLSDPVEKYIPSFEGLTVATGEDENGITTEPADHPMTIRELMSHTSGLSYGIFSQSPVDTKYREADMTAPGSTLQDMIDKLSGIPLRQQPGTIWHYSLSVDVQGYLVEVLSGQRFDEFLRERIFAPL